METGRVECNMTGEKRRYKAELDGCAARQASASLPARPTRSIATRSLDTSSPPPISR